jgi:preprotein translocase subunit SecG
MGYVDGWTILSVIFVIAQIVFSILATRKKKQNAEQDSNATANASYRPATVTAH